MPLPGFLAAAVNQEIESIDRAELTRAAAELAQQYQAEEFSSPPMRTAAHRAAYLATRLPATYAANLRVFSEIRRLAPEAAIGNMLDLGAGPGTSLYAAAEVFPSITAATLLEPDSALIELGKKLAGQSDHAGIRNAKWLRQDMNSLACEPRDLVVLSYALGELPRSSVEKLVSKAWDCTNQFLAIIEPGTVRGFGLVHAARSLLIDSAAPLLAPCPHALQCPMYAAADWCHFAVRVERTSIHRRLKGGSLGYEDEKFSYVVASRQPFPTPAARIVRHPQKRSGHVQLTLCTASGLQNETVGKSQKEKYKSARRAEWGDPW
jgi:ribosomal protein RSM22 (predicted rRNA methylase)